VAGASASRTGPFRPPASISIGLGAMALSISLETGVTSCLVNWTRGGARSGAPVSLRWHEACCLCSEHAPNVRPGPSR